jgi:hypothetical protein
MSDGFIADDEFVEDAAPAAPPGPREILAQAKAKLRQEAQGGMSLGATLTGAAHGISSGTGPLSRLAKGIVKPEALAQNEQAYAQAQKDAPASAAVGDFVGGAYTPESALVGSAIGGGLGMARRAIAAKAGAKKVDALARAAAKAKADAEAALSSEVGRLGGMSQDLNRKVEWVIRLLDEEKSGTLSAASRTALEQFRKSPEYAAVIEKATARVLAQAPGSAGRVAAQEAVVGQMRQDLPQTVVDKTMDAVSTKTAKEQIGARVKRYWPNAVAAAIGGTIGGPVGAGAGAAAGFAGRPMVRALGRMMSNPAVQYHGYSLLERGVESPTATVLQKALARGLPATASKLSRNSSPVDPFAEFVPDEEE